MILNIIFSICFYPVILILYFVMKTNCKPKKNVIIGATIPTEFLDSPEIAEICKQYKKDLKRYLLIFSIIPVLFFFIQYMSISSMLWMMWLLVLIVVSSYPYIKYNKKLMFLKAEKNWNGQNSGKIFVDMKTAAEKIRTMNYAAFIPSVMISCIPIAIELWNNTGDKAYYSRLIALVSIGSVTLIFFIIGLLIDRQKTDIISLNSDINSNYNRAKKRIWTNSFLLMSWLNTVFTFAMWAFLSELFKSNILFLLLVISYTIIIAYLCFKSGVNATKVQRKLIANSDNASDTLLVDDDANWIWGMIYYNPKAGSTMVDKRDGIGFTINMASSTGKFLMGFTFLALLSIPLMSIWLIFEEFTPIRLELVNNQIVAEHLKAEYAIDLEDIKSVTLINKLPKASRRIGTGMDTLDKGSFSVDGYGDCEICLNPQNTAFIVIETEKGIYIFSDEDDAVTKNIYQQIISSNKTASAYVPSLCVI